MESGEEGVERKTIIGSTGKKRRGLTDTLNIEDRS